MKPWFEQNPQWLAAELAALDAAGIAYRRDQEAFCHGKARLHLEVNVEGFGPLALTVTFPDLYPYFRFEVQAHGLDLQHHQNPFQKNLCLLPRSTTHWEPTDTVASVLASQLPKVLRTGQAALLEEVAGQEIAQAEPISVYYDAHPYSMIIVQSGWEIPAAHVTGRMVVGTQAALGTKPQQPLRGALLKVLDQGKAVLAQADPAITRGYAGVPINGMWMRVPAAILKPKPIDFLQEIFDRAPSLRNAPANQVQGGFLKLWGVIFPEEVGHRRMGEGWLFICHFEENINRLNRKLEALRAPAVAAISKRR